MSNRLIWEHWTIDTLGRVRPGEAGVPDPIATGWVDRGAGVGSIEEVGGQPADSAHLPSEVLDLLDRRYPGARWFLPARRAA